MQTGTIFFINENTGFMSGEFSVNHYGLLKTSNGGYNWSLLYTNITEGIGKIQFVDQNNGYIIGSDTFYRTINGGLNWSPVFINQIDQNHAVDFSVINVNNIILSGTGGFVAKSTNGGINWSKKSQGTDLFLNDIRFCDMNTGFALR